MLTLVPVETTLEARERAEYVSSFSAVEFTTGSGESAEAIWVHSVEEAPVIVLSNQSLRTVSNNFLLVIQNLIILLAYFCMISYFKGREKESQAKNQRD